MDSAAPGESMSLKQSLPSSEERHHPIFDAPRHISEVCGTILMAWAALRLFFQFGDYSYYYGAGYVFDVIAIIVLLFLADLFTRNYRGNDDEKNSGNP